MAAWGEERGGWEGWLPGLWGMATTAAAAAADVRANDRNKRTESTLVDMVSYFVTLVD